MPAGTRLHSINLTSPGFLGLNSNKSIEEQGWATLADNCVIDDNGRLAARKGWTQTTTTPISGTPAIEQLFEYLDAAGNSIIINAAASKLYSGTTTHTEITGSLTITDDNWKFQNINGNMVGFQEGHAPLWWDGTGNAETLQAQISDWATGTTYAAGDVVKALSSANPTLYFQCTTAGDSHATTEPTWDTTAGNTTADNTATWTTRTFPVGDTVLAAFGRIWTTDSTKTVLEYSDLLIPYKFRGGSAGVIDLKSVWVYGMDQIVSIEEFNGFLLIFGKKNIVVYAGPSDPSTMAIQDTVDGTGCVARDTVQNIGTDVLFLSDSGVRSFRKTIQEKSMPLNDISTNVRGTVVAYIAADTNNLLRSVYHEKEGFYILTFPTSSVDYVFDVRQQLQDGSFRCTTWTGISPTAWVSARNGTLYMGQAGVVGTYQNYLDNASTYTVTYYSPWMTLGGHNLKFPKSMTTKVSGGNAYVLNMQIAYDYDPTFKTTQVTIESIDAPAEYGSAEYNIAEWSGGSNDVEIKAFMKGSGHTLQIGLSAIINGLALSFQNIELHATTGRLS